MPIKHLDGEKNDILACIVTNLIFSVLVRAQTCPDFAALDALGLSFGHRRFTLPTDPSGHSAF